MTIHDFQESLARSRSYVDAPWWLEVYRSAFPGLQGFVNVREDGWAQRAGIDRVLTLRSGKTINVDEKVRERDWPDILLERWSDRARKRPGWIQQDLACDFIAYAFAPSRTCYLLPFLSLRRAWKIHGRDWIEQFPAIEARNNGYVTESVPVPIAVLLPALTDAMRVIWSQAA